MASGRPDYYTPKQLAKYLGVGVEMINQYTRKGLLTREKMYIFADECRYDIFWLPEGPDGIDEQVTLLEGWTFSGNNYKLEEVERFEKEHPDLIPPKEDYPGLPGEKSLIGWKAISEPFGLKVWKDGKKPNGMKKHTEKENFPLMKLPGKKQRPYAYLSQIQKYLASSQKK